MDLIGPRVLLPLRGKHYHEHIDLPIRARLRNGPRAGPSTLSEVAMAFADPQSVTINAVAQSLARTSSGPGATGAFQKDDGLVRLSVAHSYGSRTRRTIRLDHSKVAADPFDSSLNAQYSMSVYLVVDHPRVGYTNAEQKQVVDAITAYLTASTGARVTQLLGGEN